jgi:hypothetical protein
MVNGSTEGVPAGRNVAVSSWMMQLIVSVL